MARHLLTIAELAKVLGKSRSTINDRIRDGQLPFEVITDFGPRCVRRTDVEAFLRLPDGALSEAS